MNKFKITTEKLISFITILTILGLWYICTNFGLVNTKLIPSPQSVWKAFCEVCVEYKGYSLLQHIWISMQRLLIAMVIAFAIAIPLGLASGFNSKIRAVFEPIIGIYRPLPPLAYYTLILLALGIGDKSKITLLLLSCFAPIYVTCVAAVAKVKEDYIRGAYTAGASRWQVFCHVIFPACIPDIFLGVRTSVSICYTTLVAAEMVAANSGIGWMVLDAKNWFRNDIIFVGIFVLGIMGVAIDKILCILEKKLVPWSGKM